jgi:hypothetical protein
MRFFEPGFVIDPGVLFTFLKLVHILETVAAQELSPDFYYLFDIQSTTGKNDWTLSCNFCFLVFLLNQRKIDIYFRTHIVVDVCDFLDVRKLSLPLFIFFWVYPFELYPLFCLFFYQNINLKEWSVTCICFLNRCGTMPVAYWRRQIR